MKVYLAKSHHSLGIVEARIGILKSTLKKFNILHGTRDITNEELATIISVTLGVINQIPSFTYQGRILSPSSITQMNKPQDRASLTLPDFYYKKYPDISTFFEESRINALLAVAESKLSVFETQPIGKYSNRVKGYLLTPGCIVADLCLVRENHTISNTLSRVIAKTKSGMGCIIYRV